MTRGPESFCCKAVGKKLTRPILIYDGDCRFCGKWIRRWKESTGDKVEYARSQDVGKDFPEIPEGRYDEAIQWIEPSGLHAEGAEAVFRTLAAGGWQGRLLLWLYLKVALFASISRSGYGFIARHRMAFSRLTRWLWGESVERPTYSIAAWLFLRALALIYLVAFLSYWSQVDGLISSTGILPFQNFLHAVHDNLGAAGFWRTPSLGWLWQHDALPHLLCVGGVLLSIVLFLGWIPGPSLLLLWAFYLSLAVMGQVFYGFQWDVLLLEAGFLAILVAPWHRLTWSRSGNPPALARLLILWLLFRLIFSAGVVKLSSGDATWANLTALNYHFWTQPIPDWIAWYVNQFPEWIKKGMTLGMFGAELLLPLFFFAPRRLRFFAFAGTVILQVAIIATGNYGFFNLLTLALALWLVDDLQWPGGLLSWVGALGVRYLPPRAMMAVVAVIFALSLVPFLSIFRQPFVLLKPLTWAYDYVAPFRIINSYGLFAVMTTQRREIIIQGTVDGYEWRTYHFRYKPGTLTRKPPFITPYMPRLDWQMWFAALGPINQSPWMMSLFQRLLQGSPSVLDLFEADPFEGTRPVRVRAKIDDYRFTTWNEREASGAWWDSTAVGFYSPEVQLPKAPTP